MIDDLTAELDELDAKLSRINFPEPGERDALDSAIASARKTLP